MSLGLATDGPGEPPARGRDPLARPRPLASYLTPRTLPLAEWSSLLLASPLLLFPSRLTLLGALLLAAPWLLRRLATGHWTLPTPAHRPVLLLLLALALSLLPSVSLAYSAAKFWGLLLGLATFYACLHTCRSLNAARWAARLLLAAGVILAEVGMLGMATPPDKVVDANELYTALPRLLVPVQSSTIVTHGINANEVAGVLTLFAPLAVTLAFSRGWMRPLAIPSAVLILITLVLTQSRGAVAGLAIALLVGLLWRGRRRGALITMATLVLAGLGGLALLEAGRLTLLLQADTGSDASTSLASRVELWRSGLAMLLDMPITGIGLNTFPLLLRDIYPAVHRPAQAELLMPHAHNLFLQTALDFGLLGLFAFLTLVALAVRGGLAAVRTTSPDLQNPKSKIQNPLAPLAIGLLLGLLAHGIYSLADAVALGAKPGPILWAELGLLIALGPLAPQNPKSKIQNPKSKIAPALLLLALPLLLAPLAVNAARLVAHKAAYAPQANSPLVEAGLNLVAPVAWGPYHARLWAVRAQTARDRQDVDTELAALAIASPAVPWDAVLAWRLGELRLQRGDTAGAVDAWRQDRLVEPLLLKASQQPTRALDWFALAQAVDPKDWRPYTAAASLLARLQQRERAALLLAEALRLRGPHPARTTLADRLNDAVAPLPRDLAAPLSPIDANLFAQASQLLAARSDLTAALYAAQLAAQAEPANPSRWRDLVTLLRQLGQADAANQAELRAQQLAPVSPHSP